MTGSGRSANHRDDLAADRDDTAERRDICAAGRDGAADERDAQAVERGDDTGRDLADLDGRLVMIGRQIVDHLAHIENSGVDPASWPSLAPAEIARLAERRRLAARDREAVTGLIGDLRATVQHLRGDDVEAFADRRAAGRDRRRSAGDRDASAGDRAWSAQDRDQSAIERAQADPPDLGQVGPFPSELEHPPSHTAHAVAEARHRIVLSRALLSRTGRPVDVGSDPPSTRDAG